jgi:hypothetical protein
MLRLAGGDEAAVGQHDVGLQQIVDGQAELTGEIAQPTAQGDPSNPGGGDDAAGGGQAEGVRGVMQVAEQGAPFDAGSAGCRVDPHPVHRGEIDHQAVIDEAQSRAVVAAAADGHDEIVVTREVDRGDDVADGGALGDEGRVLVDHRVVDGAGVVVARIPGLDERAAHACG